MATIAEKLEKEVERTEVGKDAEREAAQARKSAQSSLARAVRRGKVNAEKRLAYVRLQGTVRGALDQRVREKVVTIGRKGGGADCQLRVESRTVSRLHAKLEWSAEERSWMIHCLSKKNGVLVDGVPISCGMPPLPLRSCQLIELGDTALYFLEPKAPLVYTNDIEKTEADQARKRKAKEEKAQRKNKLAKKKEEKKTDPANRKGRADAAKTNQAAKGVWTKREMSEFLRGLFATGVKFKEGGEFDWGDFRQHAGGLANKEDTALKEYYHRLMKDVEMVVDAANKSKKESGKSRRTQHRASCECVICEHSRRKAARIAAGTPRPEDLQPAGKDANGEEGDEDADNDEEREKIIAARKEKMKSALVSLVTAQKLRVRLGLIEAANDVDSPAGVAALGRLSAQAPKPAPSGETLPEWWNAREYDRELMIGVARHGVGKWESIWDDTSLESFVKIKGQNLPMPHARAAMRRLRDVASAILAEKRRRAKRGETKAPSATKKAAAPKKPSATRGEKNSGKELLASSEEESGSEYHDKGGSDDASDDGDDASDEEDEDEDDDDDEEEEVVVVEEDDVENMDDEEIAEPTSAETADRRTSAGGSAAPKIAADAQDDDQMEEVEEIVEEVEEDDDDD